MGYFKNFPNVLYKFGNEQSSNIFSDISAYVEIIDEIKDNLDFYSYYTILDGERPDHLSQKLYGTPTLYWTFFLMNDQIRSKGWPLSQVKLDTTIKAQLPNKVITTTNSLAGIFKPGQTITGLSSGATGTILERRLDFGQLIIQSTGTFTAGELIISTVDNVIQSVQLSKGSIPQYDSIHHWQNSSGDVVDVDPAIGTSAIYTPVTYSEKYTTDNDNLRTIRIIKPVAINSVYRSFNQALSQ